MRNSRFWINNRLVESFLVTVFSIFGSGLLNAAASEKPNVLLILVDDLKPTLGCYGDKFAISPNIDRLAAQGVRFDRAYCNQAVCMASRYNLLLGSRSTSTGFYNFGTQFRDTYPDAITLPQHFMNNGYAAHSMGKVFHIGHGTTNDDESWSVPHHPDKVIDYVLPESNNRELTREEALFTNQPRQNADGNPRPRGAAWEAADVLDTAYADGRVAETAIDRLHWLKENEERPFFMAVGFARPHLPFSAPKKYWDLYDETQLPMPEFEKAPAGAPQYAVKRKGEITNFDPIPEGAGVYSDSLKRKLIHGYYASMSYMDAQVGKVLDKLEREGLAENTIVVLWGDHGYHLGDHGSWTKHSNYEQAVRIPIIISAPAIGQTEASTQQLAETVDLYPTLASLAGLPKPQGPQPIDGIDLTPVLKDPELRLRDHAYHSFLKRGNLGRAVVTERYRLVEWTSRGGKRLGYELYDYQEDPLETRNIAADTPEVLERMVAILGQEPAPKWQVGKKKK